MCMCKMKEIITVWRIFFKEKLNFFNLNILRLQDFGGLFFLLYIIVDDILKIYLLRKK